MEERPIDQDEEIEKPEEREQRPVAGEAQETEAPSGRPGGARKRYVGRVKVCTFCTEKVSRIDYKQYDMLRRFLTERAKIRPRRQTGTCARHQRALARAIKRARHLALLPFTGEHLREG